MCPIGTPTDLSVKHNELSLWVGWGKGVVLVSRSPRDTPVGAVMPVGGHAASLDAGGSLLVPFRVVYPSFCPSSSLSFSSTSHVYQVVFLFFRETEMKSKQSEIKGRKKAALADEPVSQSTPCPQSTIPQPSRFSGGCWTSRIDLLYWKVPKRKVRRTRSPAFFRLKTPRRPDAGAEETLSG